MTELHTVTDSLEPADRTGQAEPAEYQADHEDAPGERGWPQRAWRWATHRHESAVTASCLSLFMLFSLLRPENFLTESNLVNVARDASILLILTVGITFVTVMGMFDLSIGSVLVFSQVAAVKVMIGLGGQSVATLLIGALAAVAAGAAWGIVNGWLIATLRLSPFIVTLATLGAALGAAELLSGGGELTGIPINLNTFIGIDQFAGLPYLVWFAVITALIGGFALAKTRFGRLTYAIGSNAEAVRRAGVNTGRHIVKIYLVMGILSGIAGYLGAARFGTTSLAGHTNDSLDTITAAALGGCSLFGGIGTVLGAAIGVTIPALLQNGLVILGTQPYWEQITVAAALLASIYLDRRRRQAQHRE